MSAPQDDHQRDPRWPRSVYGVGAEPDPRFSFANERTFLAWMRTSLALLGAAVAVDVLTLGLPAWATATVAVVLSVMSVFSAAIAWQHWRQAERAMRVGDPLPAPTLAPLAGGLVVIGVVVIAGVVSR